MFILDKNPRNAARYLTKAHMLKYYKTMTEELPKVLRNPKAKSSISFFRESYKTLNFYLTFYDSIYDELNNNNVKVPEKFNTNLFKSVRSFRNVSSEVYFDREPIPSIVQKIFPRQSMIIDRNDLITRNRLIYILLDYNSGDFLRGKPEWYDSTSKIVYERKSRISRDKVRITLEDKEYRYFINLYDNIWKEIKNVPPEMRYIIDSFINY